MDMDWFKTQLDMNGLTQRAVADALGISEQKMSHIFTGRRQIKADEADKIRRLLGYTLPEDREPTIAVSGRVAAGDHVELADDYLPGAGMFHIARPAWVPARGVAAAQVDGSSAEPMALSGDIIFWTRQAMGVSDADLGRPVIAQLGDGRVVFKRLASSRSPGRWSLLSINPTHPNLMDVDVIWASRVLAPLAFDDVRIVEA